MKKRHDCRMFLVTGGCQPGIPRTSGDFETHFSSVTGEQSVFAHLRFLDFTRRDASVSNRRSNDLTVLREMTSPSAGFPKTFSTSLENTQSCSCRIRARGLTTIPGIEGIQRSTRFRNATARHARSTL